MIRFVLFSLAFWLSSYLPTIAQTSTDSLRTMPTDTTGQTDDEDPNYAVADADQDSIQSFHYRFSTDGIASTGNVQRLLLQLSTALDWKPTQQFKLSSSPSFVYGKQGGLLAERELFADVRGSFWHQKSVYGLAFVSWDRSNLRQILDRWTQAAGVGFKLIQKKRAYLSITNLLLHESTDFVERNDIDLWRNSTRLLGEFAPGKTGKFTITSVLFLQPAISVRNNTRCSGTLSMAYRMSHNVSLRTKFEDTYESYVVPGRKSNDFRWTLGLSIEN